MKKFTLLTGLIIAISQFVIAQNPVIVGEDKLATSDGTHPAYLLEVPHAKIQSVTKNWSKHLESFSKEKTEKEGDILINDNLMIPSIHHDTIKIFSMVYQLDTTVRLLASFHFDSAFFDPAVDESDHQFLKKHNHIQGFSKTFGTNQYADVVEANLKEEKNKLSKLEKDRKSLMKDNEKIRKSVQENKQNIQNAKDEIATLEKDNNRLLEEISAQRVTVSNLEGNEMLQTEAKEQLKALEKEKKGVEKQMTKERKNIVGYESDIKKAEHELIMNDEMQTNKVNEISAQKEIIQKVETNLSELR